MLEYFVHLDADDAPTDLVLATAQVPANLPRESVQAADLPSGWRRSPAPAALAQIGDQFVRRGKHCVLMVPSALAPNENNWLLNPQHADFRKIVLSTIEPLRYDPRMFAPRRRPRRRP
jgi:RES domain-containing protein